MQLTFFVTLTLTSLSLSQTPSPAPAPARKVYMTSNQDRTFVIVPTARTNGSALVVQKLTSTPSQQWLFTSLASSPTTRIQLLDTTLCIDAGAKSAWKDMARLYVRPCSETEAAQKWTEMGDGRIALAESSGTKLCIDLQYMKAVQNNPVGMYNCAGLGNTGAADKGINWPLVDVA